MDFSITTTVSWPAKESVAAMNKVIKKICLTGRRFRLILNLLFFFQNKNARTLNPGMLRKIPYQDQIWIASP